MFHPWRVWRHSVLLVCVALAACSGGSNTQSNDAPPSSPPPSPSPATSTGEIAFSNGAYSVAQNAGSVVLSVNRINGSSGAASVAYATVNGTANAGSDYTQKNSTINWADGDTSTKSISVAINNATGFTGTKTFSVVLSAPSGASLGSISNATVTITGSGSTPAPAPAGTIALSKSDYSVSTSASTVTITVSRTGGSSGAASIKYATSNGTATANVDYKSKSGTLTWAAGSSGSQTFPVEIISTGQGGKSFGIALSDASGASLGTPATAKVTITPASAAWSAEAWSAAYQTPAKLDSLWSKTGTITADNGAVYYGRMNAWNSGSSGFRYQKTWINNEHDWGVTSTHVNDGQVKSYSSIVRGWAIGEGFNGINNSGLGIRVSALTKARVRWAFEAPSDYGGGTGANATNRVNVLLDTYFHTTANPGPNDTAHISLMINQYNIDGDSYYGGLARDGETVTLGGRQWQMYQHKTDWATGNTIELFPGPFNDYKVFGTKDLTFDYLAIVKDLVARGLIPSTDYLTSIQAGFEVIAGGTFRTTQFWTALQSEEDGP